MPSKLSDSLNRSIDFLEKDIMFLEKECKTVYLPSDVLTHRFGQCSEMFIKLTDSRIVVEGSKCSKIDKEAMLSRLCNLHNRHRDCMESLKRISLRLMAQSGRSHLRAV